MAQHSTSSTLPLESHSHSKEDGSLVSTRADPVEHSSNDKPFSCPQCERLFAQSRYLKYHMMIHTGEKPHSCPICNKKFVQRYAMKLHIMNMHTGDKPHHCATCGKSFAQYSQLKRHMLIHSVEKPHSCPVCNKKFVQRYAMKIHVMNRHTSDKPYQCETCDKSFAQLPVLRRHMLVHSKEKQNIQQQTQHPNHSYDNEHQRHHPLANDHDLHHCFLCSEAFPSGSLLEEHMMSKHDENYQHRHSNSHHTASSHRSSAPFSQKALQDISEIDSLTSQSAVHENGE